MMARPTGKATISNPRIDALKQNLERASRDGIGGSEFISSTASLLAKEYICEAEKAHRSGDGRSATLLSNDAADYFVIGVQTGLSNTIAKEQSISFSFTFDRSSGVVPTTDRQREIYALIAISNAIACSIGMRRARASGLLHSANSPASQQDAMRCAEEARMRMVNAIISASSFYKDAAKDALALGDPERAARMSAYGERVESALARNEIVLPWETK